MPLLIIRDQLVNPPTWFPSFRDLTMYSETFLGMDTVLETDPESRDIYWKWLKQHHGGLDFLKDLVESGRENGLRLDNQPTFPRTIVTDRIVPENIWKLIGKIQKSL